MGGRRTGRMRQVITGVLAVVAAGMLAAPAVAQIGLVPVPGTPPPGANDRNCVPRADRPPVILVHGTLLDMTTSWPVLAPMLVADGFCVYALDYGRRGTAPVDASADTLAAFARGVLEDTGAPKVSFVGHSQGGLLARWTVKSRGLLDRTSEIVGLAPSHHGTTSPGAPFVAGLGCPACADQIAGSPFLALVNSEPEAPVAIDHTVVTTVYDEVVTPPSSQALTGATVGNVVLQDQCPNDLSEHLAIIYDPVALNWVRHALLREGPADPGARADCGGRRLPKETAGAPATPSRPTETRPEDPARASPRRLQILSRNVVARDDGTLHLRVRCVGAPEDRCSSLIRVRHDDRVLGTLRATLPADRSATLSMTLSAAGRRFVADHPRGARVVIRATTAGADPRVTSRTATLRRD